MYKTIVLLHIDAYYRHVESIDACLLSHIDDGCLGGSGEELTSCSFSLDQDDDLSGLSIKPSRINTFSYCFLMYPVLEDPNDPKNAISLNDNEVV